MQNKLEVLSRSPLFEMLSNPELEVVAGLAQSVVFKEDETIFEEGSLGDCVYVIASGEVALSRRGPAGNEEALAMLDAPQVFGEMSLIDTEYRSATARARTPVELLHLTAENLTNFRRRHPDGFTLIIINIARVLSSRLRDAISQLAARG